MKLCASLILPLILFFLQLPMVKLHTITSPSNESVVKNESEETKKMNYLRVASIQFEPFVHQDKSGHILKGVEFELVKTIAKKEHLNFSFEIWPSLLQFDQSTIK